MTATRPARLRPARRPLRTIAAVVTLVASAVALTGCGTSSAGAGHTLKPKTSGTSVQSGLEYWTDGSSHLLLDACLPSGHYGKRPSVVLVHSGGLRSGLRNDPTERELCIALSKWGYAAFSIDYRPTGAYSYPAQVTDLDNAITWLRKAKQVKSFGIDPKRFAVLGSTLGGNIALEQAMAGSGAQDTGTRVKAVVAISGLSVLTNQAETLGKNTASAVQLAKTYLACTNLAPAQCKNAQAASAVNAVDRTDPATLLINGVDEATPPQQAQAMQRALQGVKVPVQLVLVPGNLHGLALLKPAVRRNLHQFLDKYV